MRTKPIWVPEDIAAAMMNYQPYTFRRLVKSGKLDIAYSAPTGRKYQYNKLDIEKVQLQSSNLMAN
jgi:hypothetical protein